MFHFGGRRVKSVVTGSYHAAALKWSDYSWRKVIEMPGRQGRSFGVGVAVADHSSARPTGGGGASDDFLLRLSLAEARDNETSTPSRRTATKAPTTPPSKPRAQLVGVLKRTTGPKQRRSISFHPSIVTRVEEAAEDVDRTAIPCLALGLGEFAPEEQKLYAARATIKHFRGEAGRRDEVARVHFNAAATDEARLRATQTLEEVLMTDDRASGPRPGAARGRARGGKPPVAPSEPTLAERHYTEMVSLMQKANKQYHHQLQLRRQQQVERQARAPAASGPPPAPTTQKPATAVQTQRVSTRIAQPPGGRATFVFG